MDETAEAAWNAALRKLSRKDRTSQEIRKFLADQDYASEIVEATVAQLVERRFLDDARYAAAFTRLQGMRGKGPAVIRSKLKQKGVVATVDEIRTTLEEAQGIDELARAIEIVERRYPGFREDRGIGKKAYEALVRRGFSFETARRAVTSPAPPEAEDPGADAGFLEEEP